MPSSTSTEAANEVRDLTSSALRNNVMFQPQTSRRTRQRHTRAEERREVHLYSPNSCHYLDQVFALEQKLEHSNIDFIDSLFAFSLSIRIYYAILFHLRILLAQKEAKTATNEELELVKHFDSDYHIQSLPIHDSMYAVFRETFPACRPSHSHRVVSPEPSDFMTFTTESGTDGIPIRINNFPATHTTQPNPILGMRLLRWFNWKRENPDDSDLPDQLTRLNFMSLDTEVQFQDSTPQQTADSKAILDTIFRNPIFRQQLPNGGSFKMDYFRILTTEAIPDRTIPNPHRHRTPSILGTALLMDCQSTWFNELKYIVAMHIYATDVLTLFDTVNQPYTTAELEAYLPAIHELNAQVPQSQTVGSSCWMTPYDHGVESFVTLVVRNREPTRQPTPRPEPSNNEPEPHLGSSSQF
jgi:hypothetical protein